MSRIAIAGKYIDPTGNVRSRGTGKGTFADMLCARHPCLKMGLADEIKRICLTLWPAFSSEHFHGESSLREEPVEVREGVWLTARKAAQQIGSAARALDEDVWVHRLDEAADRVVGHVICCDVRYPNELQKLRMLGWHMVLLLRYSDSPFEQHVADQHSSETSVAQLQPQDFDTVVLNESLEALRTQAQQFIF